MVISTAFVCLCSDYLFKLLLIGDSGVGKSCLLLRFAVSNSAVFMLPLITKRIILIYLISNKIHFRRSIFVFLQRILIVVVDSLVIRFDLRFVYS